MEHHSTRLLLAVVRQRWDEARRLVEQQSLDGPQFVAVCREADVHPWVHFLLAERGHMDWIGPEATRTLERIRTKLRQDNVLLLARAEQALGLLLDAGVTPVALKGLDLLHRLYASFDQRTIDDVDLLVRREELPRALEVLQGAGWTLPPEPLRTHYVRSSHHLPLRSPGPVTVDFELHWNLAQEGRYTIDVEGLFARAHPLEIGGHRVLRLADDDLVAHLLVHHLSHYFDRRLKWLVDLQRLASESTLDWRRVAQRMREWNGTGAAGISLVHLKKLSPDLIPDTILREIPVAWWRRALTWPLRSSHPLELFRRRDRRSVQLYLAAVMIERPGNLPGWLLHRRTRNRQQSANPLDRDVRDNE